MNTGSREPSDDRVWQGRTQYRFCNCPASGATALGSEVGSSIGRIHHPSGAAPLGTQVGARFCNGLLDSKLTLLVQIQRVEKTSALG
jgi:hypothetical protein